jgi:heat shock protein HslJ
MRTPHPLLCLGLAALAGCSSAGPADAATATAQVLEAQAWVLAGATDSQGQPIAALQPIAGRPVQIEFAAGHVAVRGGCNRLAGNYQLTDGALQLGVLAQTRRACPDARLMQLDAALAQRLQGTVQARLSADAPPQLWLRTGDGDRLVFDGAPARTGGAGTATGTTVFLEVAPQRVPCAHPLMKDAQCLQVRERTYADGGGVATQGPWQPLYQPIEGYTHQPGVRNVLRVKRYPVANPPADGSSLAYVLELVVESEAVK